MTEELLASQEGLCSIDFVCYLVKLMNVCVCVCTVHCFAPNFRHDRTSCLMQIEQNESVGAPIRQKM